ncbi:hypothetical protein [Sphingomonas sp. CLY1604]|uniref:hypothetical protein n=1 Tax=Sphingomonas sp. CLY1604 TaxID=3457786 RepID=UPI003FD6C743
MLTRDLIDLRSAGDQAGFVCSSVVDPVSERGSGGPPPLPSATTDGFALFSEALTALSRCGDVVNAAADTTARSYVWGAAGALRHAMAFLSREGLLTETMPGEEFTTRRVGTSELLGGAQGWDTALRCRLPDGSEGRASALWPIEDAEKGVWLRPDAELPGLWRRGHVRLTEDCIVFDDGAQPDGGALPDGGPDLGRDLMSAGVPSLHRRPAFAVALEITLASGSWCHLDSGRRWFADPHTARSIVRILGATLTIDTATARRLAGVVDREALLLIERQGWRHVPTPSV